MDCKKIISMTTEDTLNNKTGSWRTMRPVVSQNKCKDAGKKCGLCKLFCPDCAVLVGDDGVVKINLDYCKGCGICANECPRKAIEMVGEVDCDEEK